MQKFRLSSVLLTLWFVLQLLLFSVWAAELRLVLNPYEGIQWETWQQCRANFHTHTSQSDGSASPDRMIDQYRRLGYQILALTDHNLCTWPWEKWDRNPQALGMLAVPGNELSRHHHTLSLFCKLETSSEDLEQSLKEVAAAGGLAVLAHPGRYWKPEAEGQLPGQVLSRYRQLFVQHPTLLGMEVFNADDRYPHDRQLWDGLLAELMPHRPVWGFANDDAHSRTATGLNWAIVVVPKLEEGSVRQALEAGRFYFSTVTLRQLRQRSPDRTPTLVSVRHDPQHGTISLAATCGGGPAGETECRWIAAGRVIHVGWTIPYRSVVGLGNYVRAEIHGPGGVTFTQPFGFVSE